MLVSPCRTIDLAGAVRAAAEQLRQPASWPRPRCRNTGTVASTASTSPVAGRVVVHHRASAGSTRYSPTTGSCSPKRMLVLRCGIFTCASGAPSATRRWRSAW